MRKKIDDARSIWEANPENKGKTFDATGISLSDSENQGFNEMYKIQIAAFEKNLKEYQSLQKDAWNEYYIEYGKYQEKRMAIMEKYDKQIAKAEEGSVEKATLTAQRKKNLMTWIKSYWIVQNCGANFSQTSLIDLLHLSEV